MELPRVFFDTNGDIDGGYWLGFTQSVEDLEALGDALRPGMPVTIYMPNELEMTATLRFDEETKVWIGVPVEGTIKYLDGSE